MLKVFIEDMFDVPEGSEINALPATDQDMLALAEKLSGFEIPYKVFMQAITIAAYDTASAFRYADNYLTTKKRVNKSKNPFRARRSHVLKRKRLPTSKARQSKWFFSQVISSL